MKNNLELIASDANPYKLGGIFVSKEIVLAVYRFDKALLGFAIKNGYLEKNSKAIDLTIDVREKMKKDYVSLGGVVKNFYPSAEQLESRKNLS